MNYTNLPVGAGGMILAYIRNLRENKINYQKEFLAIAQDIDRRCAYMTYIQLSLLGIPAQVSWGDTLTMKIFDVLYTPMFVYDNWINKMRKD